MPRQSRRAQDQPRRPDAFFSLGFENYVAGRHAAHCAYYQVAAHLFHHAVELILKSDLLMPAYEEASTCLERERDKLEASLGPDVVRADPDRLRVPPDLFAVCLAPYIARANELKKRFGHNMPRLWREFKAGKAGLDRFDALIQRIHHWEDIRYPAFAGGRANAIAYTPHGQRSSMRSREPTNTYDLNLDHVDELIAALIVTVGFNPALIPMHAGRSSTSPGLDDYLRENRHALWTPPTADTGVNPES